jgi:hypothetical protein
MGTPVRIVEMLRPDLAMLTEAKDEDSTWRTIRGIYELRADGGIDEITKAAEAAPKADDYEDTPYYKS